MSVCYEFVYACVLCGCVYVRERVRVRDCYTLNVFTNFRARASVFINARARSRVRRTGMYPTEKKKKLKYDCDTTAAAVATVRVISPNVHEVAGRILGTPQRRRPASRFTREG